MKVDLNLPAGPSEAASRAARRAEADGFDAVWASEIRHDPFVTLALSVATTERVMLGTGIAVAFARNPMSVAYLADDLQAASGGRFVLGLGTQVRAHVTRRFSMPWSRPADRMREFALAIRAVWRNWEEGGALDFEGEFYQHTLMAPMFVPDRHDFGRPPIMLAGVGPAMTQVAGEVADGFLCHSFTTRRYVTEVTLPALAQGQANRTVEAGDLVVVGAPFVAVGRDDEELAAAIDRTRSQIAFYASTPAYRPVLSLHGWDDVGEQLHAMSRDGRWSEMAALIGDDVLNEFAVVGSPQQVGYELRRRFGDVLARVTMQVTDGTDPAVMAEVADAVRTA